MRKLNVFIALLILSVVMLIVGIYIGINYNRKGTITNTTNVDSIRYAIHQQALESYSAELETPDKQCVFHESRGRFF